MSVIVLVILVCLLAMILFFITSHASTYYTISGGNVENNVLLMRVSLNRTKGKTYDDAKNEILWLDTEWNKNKKLRQEFNSKIVPLLHPFTNMKVQINSALVGNVKVTNAFIKCCEFIHKFKVKYESLYDIASAPGMFIIAAQHMSKKPIKWHACSLFDAKNKYLGDTYHLFKKYPENVIDLNLLDYNACDNVIKNEERYDLVTGDVGYVHGYNTLQETSHINLQYSQARLATNLVKEGGNVFLKMYSCISNNNIWLLNNLYSLFDDLYIWKPYSSRITNDETYIVGLHRNAKTCDLPITPPTINEVPNNAPMYYTYYYNLARLKNDLVMGKPKTVAKWLKDMKPLIDAISSLTTNDDNL